MNKSKLVKVIAVTGGKGGVGKTNVTINTAVALAELGKRVLVLDADLGLANCDVLLGLRAEKNLSHVLSGECELEEILLEGPRGIMIVPAASGTQSMVELTPAQHAGLIRAFSELRTPCDVLLIDTAAGISDMVLSFSRAAQDQWGDVATKVEESVHGIRVLRSFGRGRDALQTRFRQFLVGHDDGREVAASALLGFQGEQGGGYMLAVETHRTGAVTGHAPFAPVRVQGDALLVGALATTQATGEQAEAGHGVSSGQAGACRRAVSWMNCSSEARPLLRVGERCFDRPMAAM